MSAVFGRTAFGVLCWIGVVLTWTTARAITAATEGVPTPKAQAPVKPTEVKSQRLALVVGNSAYQSAPLVNPVNDARAISQSLRESGFQVVLKENADQKVMVSAIREFGDRLRNGGVGLFYFAGHGMQIKGRNYLVPVGEVIEREDEVAYNTVDAQAILDKMESAGNVTNIMILDACRNNPFVRSGRSSQAGLAQMDAPVGTLLAYATSPGAVASDGTGTNGLYTQHLLKAMRQEGLKIEDVFKQVRSNVRRDSKGAQVPWESTSLEGDFYFKKPAIVPATPHSSTDTLEIALWDAVKDSNLPIEIRAYLNRYPKGQYSEEAKVRLVKLQSQGLPAGSSHALVATGERMPPDVDGGRIAPVKVSYEVGDSWTFVQEDLLAFRQSEYTHTVTALRTNGVAEVNGGTHVYGTNGELSLSKQASRTVVYGDGFHLLATQLSPGHKDVVKYENTIAGADGVVRKSSGFGFVKVAGREKIILPAGTFWAWRMERQASVLNANAEEVLSEDIVWFVPEVQRIVAREQKVTVKKSGALSVHELHVLQSFKLVSATRMSATAKHVDYASRLPGGVAMGSNILGDQEAVDHRTNELLAELSALSKSVPAPDQSQSKKSAAASNSLGFAVGDRWRYQLVDKYKNEVVRNFSYKVDQVLSDGSMKWNGDALLMTPEGNLQKEIGASWESREFSPYDPLVPKELQVGYKQPVEFTMTARRKSDGYRIHEVYSGTLEITRREKVVVPAGEFDAFRLERVLKFEGVGADAGDRWYGRNVTTGWYVPELRGFVARDLEVRIGSKAPTRERVELTSFSVREPVTVAHK